MELVQKTKIERKAMGSWKEKSHQLVDGRQGPLGKKNHLGPTTRKNASWFKA